VKRLPSLFATALVKGVRLVNVLCRNRSQLRLTQELGCGLILGLLITFYSGSKV